MDYCLQVIMSIMFKSYFSLADPLNLRPSATREQLRVEIRFLRRMAWLCVCHLFNGLAIELTCR